LYVTRSDVYKAVKIRKVIWVITLLSLAERQTSFWGSSE